MWICPNCETNNEDSEQYCACCGERRLSETSSSTSSNRQQQQQSTTQQQRQSTTQQQRQSTTQQQQQSTQQLTSTKSAEERQEENGWAKVVTVILVAAFYYLVKKYEPELFSEHPVLAWAPAVALPLALWGQVMVLRIPAALAVGYAALKDFTLLLNALVERIGVFSDFLLVIISILIIVAGIFCAGIAFVAGGDTEEKKKSQ